MNGIRLELKMSKIFKMRAKPAKPVRKRNITVEMPIYNDISLKEIIDYFSEKGYNNLEHIVFEDCSFYPDCREYYFSFCRDETDEEFNKRLEKYKERLKEYNKWYAENKEEIDFILAQKKDKKVKKEVLENLEKKSKLLAEIEKIDSKLEKIK